MKYLLFLALHTIIVLGTEHISKECLSVESPDIKLYGTCNMIIICLPPSV